MKFKINNTTFAGIIIIGFGTYLIYSGSKKDADKSQGQITSKLDSFSKRLENTKSSNLTPIEKQKQIDTIQTQFDDWAKNLNENYREEELLHEKQLITREEKIIGVQKQWNVLLNKTFGNIIKMVNSINKTTLKNKIKIRASQQSVPQDFFRNKEDYLLELEFGVNSLLDIRVDTSVLNSPSIHFALFSHKEKESRNVLFLQFFNNNGDFYIQKHGSFNDFVINKEKNFYSQNDLIKIIEEILAYQIILSSKNIN